MLKLETVIHDGFGLKGVEDREIKALKSKRQEVFFCRIYKEACLII